MTLDHYVSQVHLKQFGDETKDGRLNAVRKSDLKSFSPWPKDICRINEGSTNLFLDEPRIIEEFLRGIEPAYDECLQNVRNEEVGEEERAVFSGFFAFIGAYTPTALRLSTPLLQSIVEQEGRILSDQGVMPLFPEIGVPGFGGKSFRELIDSGLISIEIDPQKPQAITTGVIPKIMRTFAMSDWSIVHADEHSSLFFTSDHPSAILGHVENKYAQKVFPLASDLAVIVHTETSFDRGRGYRNKFVDPKKQVVRLINTRLVQSAGDVIIFGRERGWEKPFIRKHRHYKEEMHIHSSGHVLRFQQGIARSEKS